MRILLMILLAGCTTTKEVPCSVVRNDQLIYWVVLDTNGDSRLVKIDTIPCK